MDSSPQNKIVEMDVDKPKIIRKGTRKIQPKAPAPAVEPKAPAVEPKAKTKPLKYMQFHSKSALLEPGHVLPRDSLRSLSNFSEHPVEYKGKKYPTVEHAYQAQKYVCTNKPELAEMFTVEKKLTALEAKSMGGKTGMKKHGATMDIACWDKNKDEVMLRLIESKTKLPEIRDILQIAAKNGIRFVHFSRADMYWGAHMNEDGTLKKGENKLGKIYNDIIDKL